MNTAAPEREGSLAETATQADAIASAAERLQGRPPWESLAWAAERFAPKVAFATGFGAEGCVLIDLIARHRLPIEVFTLDTGLFFPETRDLWRRLETRYGIPIRAVRPEQTVAEQAQRHGADLWRRDPDRCCALRKTEPLWHALSGLAAWVTAIRREQTKERREAQVVEWDGRYGLVKVNPLARWSHEDVWSYVRTHDVPVNPLHGRGYPSIGCEPCTSPVRPGEDTRAGRWRGRAKTECGLHGRRREPVVRPPGGDLFPAFLKLNGRSVLLVGGGQVARARLASLRAAAARVRVVAPDILPEIAESGVPCARRGFAPTDLDGVWLAVAAAPAAVNREVARAAEERHVFVNAVDDVDSASAYLGGVVRKGGVVLAVSTEGRAPALAGLLREALEAALPEDVGAWVEAAAALRARHREAGLAMERRRPALLEELNRLYSDRETRA